MTLFLIANILVGVFYIVLGLLAFTRVQGARRGKIFLGPCLSMAGMAFTNTFLYASETVSDARMWHCVAMFFWAFSYPMTLWVVFELATHRHLSAVKMLSGITVMSAVVVGLAIHPDVGGQIRFFSTDIGWARDLRGMGLWLWPVRLYALVTLLIVSGLLMNWLRKTTVPSEKKQALWLLITGLATIVVAIINIAIIIPMQRGTTIPWTPHFVGLIWAAGFVMAMWKFELMSGMPSIAMTEVLRAIQDAIVFLDADATVTEANSRVYTLLNIRPNSLIGQNIREVDAFMVVAPAIIDGFPKCDVEAEIVNSDGVQIPVRIVSTKICDDDGHYKGTVVVFQDLRSTRELVEAKRQESLAIMSAGIAHDFNNLLTVAGGYVELCQKGLDHGKSSRQTGYLGEASFALAQARSLTGQLMTFSRGGDPVRRNVSVERLVEESAGLVLAGTSVALVKQIEPGLWPVCVDPVQTGQVFNNLMLNAVQSMTSGGTLTTRLTNLRGDGGCPDMVRIQIEDTGCGIPQSIIERIFDSFFTARKGGTGLGLASVKSIINRHGGSISVQSTVGRGSIFTVDLPRGSTPDFSQTILVNTVSASNGRVLVMDDVDSVRRVAVEMLRAIGYDADSVEDGDQAVRVVKSRSDEGIPWDVVILDVTVQGGTGGIAALADIKRVQPNIGTVVSSGYSEGAELSDFKGCGFDSRLPKPYTLENLATAVAGAMEKHKSRITGQE